MGNSQAKESRPGSSRGVLHPTRNPSSPSASGPSGRNGSAQQDVYTAPSGRGSRHDLSFLGLGGSSDRDPALEPRRETKAEREARKLEKERALRAQERERSIRNESVDGGYLVTLGTYTGPEDFSKPVVRQLQVWTPRARVAIGHLRVCRLSGDWRLSGRVSMTTRIPGLSISSSPW